MNQTIEEYKARAEMAGAACAEKDAALRMCRDKIANLHDSQCDSIKSARRRWGRIEPCSCGCSTRTGLIAHALSLDCGKDLLQKMQQLARERDEARAACAEKDAVLKHALTYVHLLDDGKTFLAMKKAQYAIDHALSADCGKDYVRVDIKKMVEEFLRWHLPPDVCCDLCAIKPNYPDRIGTNLLTAEQARQMFEHVIAKMKEAK